MSKRSQAGSLLILWWLAGISPGFLSVPPASLGHTIVAMPAVYILMALPLTARHQFRTAASGNQPLFNIALSAISLLLLVTIGWRDLSDYFKEWPSRGMVRFLYRADIHDVADYLNQQGDLLDFSITGLLAGPWDRIALSIDLDDGQTPAVRARWYDPRRALIIEPSIGFSGYPNVPTAFSEWREPVSETSSVGGYQLMRVTDDVVATGDTCFQNGLCWYSASYQIDSQQLELGWYVKRPLELPAIPLISNPPPPGVYAGPRLHVFGQLQEEAGNFVSGDDGLWVDPTSLQPGDRFVQRHQLTAPEGVVPTSAVFGLYDPMSGRRILTEDGRDHLRLEIEH